MDERGGGDIIHGAKVINQQAVRRQDKHYLGHLLAKTVTLMALQWHCLHQLVLAIQTINIII